MSGKAQLLDYASYTYESRNILKRLVHRTRFRKLLKVVPLSPAARILDYGCGDGFFIRTVMKESGVSHVCGFEPDAAMARQARDSGLEIPIFARSDAIEVPKDGFTHIFCQEVIEHLIPSDLQILFDRINALANSSTIVVFTMPIEQGLAGLAKNMFRAVRKQEKIDFRTMVDTFFSRRMARSATSTSFGMYMYSHVGFRVLEMEKALAKVFSIVERHNDPFGGPLSINNSRIIICTAK